MKKYTLLQSTKSVILSGLSVLALAAIASESRGEDIFIENHSFEADEGNPALYMGVVNAWPRYNPGGLQYGSTTAADITDGILDLDFPDSPWYNDGAPEGDKILVLFSWDGESQGSLFGVQQELNAPIQGNSRYTFRVSVGNIQSGTGQSGTFLNLSDFPGYRVQLLAEGSVIYDDLNELAPEEGEFLVSDCVFEIPEGSDFIGRDITIRLTNQLMSDVRDEVNFDNVELTRDPIGVVNPGLIPAEINHLEIIGGGEEEGFVRDFTITGKGKKRVLIAGRGLSLHTGVPNRIGDPQLSVYGKKGLIAKSANWMSEKQARQIRRASRFSREKWNQTDAGMILELEAGDYSVNLSNARGVEGYGALEVYDLDLDAPAQIELLDKAAAELIQLWNSK